MSTTTAKRPLDLGSASADSSESAGSNEHESHEYLEQENESEEPRRKGGKPGRKLLDDEAKNKRTAQNRAAQRAFRERKERKMKELEDKVHSLEQVNQQSAVETEFLRSQLMTLMGELKRYRPVSTNDSQVLAYLSKNDGSRLQGLKDEDGNVNKKMDFTFAFPWKDKSDRSESRSRDQVPSPGSSSSNSASQTLSKRKMSETTPDTLTNSIGANNNNSNYSHINNSVNNNNTPSSTTTTSGWMDNVFYSDDAQRLPSFPNNAGTATPGTTLSVTDPLGQDSVLFSNHFNFEDEFDEQVSKFCSKMNEACGTKECPIPKQAPKASPMVLSNTWDANISPGDDVSGAGSGVGISHENESSNDDNVKNNDSKSTDNRYKLPQDSFDLGSEGNVSKYNAPANASSAPSAPSALSAPSAPSLSTSISSSSISNERPLNILNNDSINNFIIGNDNESVERRTSNNEQRQQHQQEQQHKQKNGIFPFLDTSLAFPNESEQNLIFRDNQDSSLLAELLEETAENNDFETNLINEEPIEFPFKQNANDVDNVVPARDGKLLKCSEVWDRITSHPKYASIDIDGLCVELMAKAKCSERGVVVQAEHVQKALDKQAAVDKDFF